MSDAAEAWVIRLQEQKAEVEAERDRLREALERIIDTHGGYPDDYAQIAREALGLESGPEASDA